MLNYQYCQKIILFSEDLQSILLAKRKGEQDYDGVYSLVGGKMEHGDASFVAGLKREKDEEIGNAAMVDICPFVTYNAMFQKKDGNFVVLPHYIARFAGGHIQLNDEYSEYQWVKIDALRDFEPKIANIPEVVIWAERMSPILSTKDFVAI